MNHERVVLTDAASSLSKEEAENLGLKLIPFHIIQGGQEFTDFTIDPKEMYRRVESHGIPSTSGPTPNDFLDFYQDLYQQGARDILSIHLGVRSMTINNALNAAAQIQENYPGVNINIINSKSLTIAQEYKVLRAKNLFDQGRSTEEIKTELDLMSKDLVLFGSTGRDAISFLKKSGRLNGLQSFVASQLNLIPETNSLFLCQFFPPPLV